MENKIKLFLLCITIALFHGCSFRSKSDYDNFDFKAHAFKLMEKGSEYYKIIRVNELTASKTDTSNYFIYTFLDSQKYISLVFSKKDNDNNIKRVITYSNDFSVINDNLTERKATKDEEILLKIYFNLNITSRFFSFRTGFWNIIERKDGRYEAILLPQQNYIDYMILGGDLLLKYDLTGEFIDIKLLHNNPIPIPLNSNDEKFTGTLHNHNNYSSEFITETDIANILLCEKKINWGIHIVVSDLFVSIFDIKNKSLIIEFKDDYERRTGIKINI
jgi:hypothetical protein